MPDLMVTLDLETDAPDQLLDALDEPLAERGAAYGVGPRMLEVTMTATVGDPFVSPCDAWDATVRDALTALDEALRGMTVAQPNVRSVMVEPYGGTPG